MDFKFSQRVDKTGHRHANPDGSRGEWWDTLLNEATTHKQNDLKALVVTTSAVKLFPPCTSYPNETSNPFSIREIRDPHLSPH